VLRKTKALKGRQGTSNLIGEGEEDARGKGENLGGEGRRRILVSGHSRGSSRDDNYLQT